LGINGLTEDQNAAPGSKMKEIVVLWIAIFSVINSISMNYAHLDAARARAG